MNAVKKEYRVANEKITGMNDDEFYGREEALGVDLDACRRAAIREVRAGVHDIIWGENDIGKLMIREAVHKLAIVLGNQTEAEEYLGLTDLPYVSDLEKKSEGAIRDAEELAKGVNRQHALPALKNGLSQIESQLLELRRNN